MSIPATFTQLAVNIRPAASTKARLLFVAESNFDFVNVYDGDDITAARIAHLHGTTIPEAISGTGSVMVVQFTSDASATADGFSGSFTCGEQRHNPTIMQPLFIASSLCYSTASPPLRYPGAGTAPPSPPAPLSACTSLQMNMYTRCIDNCAACQTTMNSYSVVVGQCTLPAGGTAVDSMHSTCPSTCAAMTTRPNEQVRHAAAPGSV